jgi:hypothetical protein
MTDTHLKIEIDGERGSVTYEGDTLKLAKAIIKIAKEDDEFAVALNVGMMLLRDNMKAIEVKKQLISFINLNK